MRRYTVMVVDDSAFMRKIISDLIAEDLEFEVIGTAKNGKEAVEKASELKPDVITLDVEMPVMNGLEALQAIMSNEPIPIIMLSSLTDDGARETIKALELGAVDFVRKPSGSISLDLFKVKDLLLDKLRIAVRAKVKRIQLLETQRIEGTRDRTARREIAAEDSKAIPSKLEYIVAIGTSTGGPKALQTVLSNIPSHFPAPILVVQHMPPNFTKSLAQRLNLNCELRVVEAEQHMEVSPGTVYIAPGGYHMKLVKKSSQYRVELTKEDIRSGHRPSVDILFESLVPFNELKRYAVIMTGMGADGAKAMKLLKSSGAKATIAEAEETCIVYGMPRAAVELNAVDYIVKLPAIAGKLDEMIMSDKSRNRS